MIKDVDECLLAYLHSTDEADQQQHLGYLVSEVATPIIQRVLHRAFDQDHINDAYGTVRVLGEDAVADVVLKILQALLAFKDRPGERAIANFRGLVATIAYRALTDQLRELYRERANHEQKIRRLLAVNKYLAIWKDAANITVCGRTEWRDEKPKSAPLPSRDELLSLADQVRVASASRNAAELILFLLNLTDQPVKFGDLVSVTLDCQRKDTQLLESESSSAGSVLNALRENPLVVLETKLLLERLFAEIQKLSAVQRKALLLNMGDSQNDGIECFLLANVATEEQLASLLEFSTAEFRQLLGRLPMTDKEIGDRLGIDSVKVGNIRKAVRDRLERRRRTFLGERKK